MDSENIDLKKLLHELITQNMLTNQRIDASINAMRRESAEANKRIDEIGKRIDETGKRIDETGKRIDETGKRIDETGKRIDETNRRMDQKFDAALQQNFILGQQIQQQQIELAKMFKKSEEYYTEIKEKLDNLSDEVRNKIGFQPVGDES